MDQKLSVGGRVQLNRFCRQYLQLQLQPDYPDEGYLRQDAFQETLYAMLFGESAIQQQHQPPERYQLKVLKELTRRIEQSIQDWEEEGISDNLMNHLSPLLSSPLPPEEVSAQQKSYVTYTLSSLPACSGQKPLQTTTPEITPPATPTYGPQVPPIITLLESRNLFAAAGTTGLRTWEASLHLGNYLLAHPSLVTSKNILELGAGTGYLSIMCSKQLRASHVLATDGSEDVVSSLTTNFFLNGLRDEERIEGKELIWGDAFNNTGKKVDVVIGADVTYDVSGIPPLVKTFGDLFGVYPGAEVVIAATVRNQATFDTFLDTCRRNKFEVEEIDFPIARVEEQDGPFYDDTVPIKICVVKRR